MRWFKDKTPKVTYLEEWEMDTILEHFSYHVGTSPFHFHDGTEDPVHVDLGHVSSHKELGCQAIFTFGMSALPIPDAHNDEAYAELLMLLPADWPAITAESQSDATWPLHWLRTLSKKPFLANGRVEPGTIVHFDAPIPGTRFVAFMYLPALLHAREFGQLSIGNKLVNFWLVVPISGAEREVANELSHPLEILDHVFHDDRSIDDSLKFFIVSPGRNDII